MYDKGKGFLGAAMLLDRQRGYDYVVLHLLCQGVEIVLKALLLFRNYDKYKPRLTLIGHDLEDLVAVAATEFGLRVGSKAFAAELKHLNVLYRRHFLRYGTFHDVLVDPETIPRERLWRKAVAVLRLASRHLPPAA